MKADRHFLRAFASPHAAVLTSLVILLATPAFAKTVRIDFGRNDGANGNPTVNPDSRGHYWNNLIGDFVVQNNLSLANLVASDNSPTPLGVTITSDNWGANGIQNGGLTGPNAALLGDLAIATATQDYFYIQGGNGTTGTLKITGLDPAKYYNFRMFGTRNVADVRSSLYTLTGGNGAFTGYLQTSGTGIGSDRSYGGNDNRVISFNEVQPDASGQVQLQLSIASGGFAYLGVMEISDAPAPDAVSKTIRVDLGPNDTTNGVATVSPDSFGNYWNNFAAPQAVPTGSWSANLVTTDNTPTSLALRTTSAWNTNGILNGGLTAPTAARLGQFAVPTATEDYFYIQGDTASATMSLSGLNPARLYNLKFFATRNVNSTRTSQYTVTAGNGAFTGNIQTSGAGLGNGTGGADGSDTYDGNNRTTLTLSGIQADYTGQISLQVSVVNGGFAYLGVLEVVEGATVTPLPLPPTPPVAITDLVGRWVAQDALDPIAPGPLVFVGSSSIRRWESLTRDFPDYNVVQRGFGGSQFSDLNPIVNKIVLPYQPSGIIVYEGTNDIRVSHKTAQNVMSDFQTFIASVRAQLPKVPIFYVAINPVPSFFYSAADDPERRKANANIAAYCASDPSLNLHFIDTASYMDSLHDAGTTEGTAAWNSYWVDDTHMNRSGYALWTSIIRPAIMAVIPPNKVFTPNPSTLQNGEKLLFDFGPSDFTNGDQTIGADANGNTWNNWHPTVGGGLINSGEHLANLVRTTGTGTGIRMTITAGFLAAGKAPGNDLLSPSAASFGDLAIPSATEDYWYSTANNLYDATNDDLPGGFMLDGLNPKMTYELRFLGSCASTETRITEFRVFGDNQQTVNLKTSGSGIGSSGGNANDSTLAIVSGIKPDAFGQIFVDLTLVQGASTHLNAMEIIATAPPSAYQNWRSSHFTAAELANAALEATVWGDLADPDGDGRTNLLEYATGTDPRIADPGSEKVGVETIGGDRYLTLTFQKNLTATDITSQAESGLNLIDWSNVADSLVSTTGQIETRKASILMGEEGHRVMRVRVRSGSN